MQENNETKGNGQQELSVKNKATPTLLTVGETDARKLIASEQPDDGSALNWLRVTGEILYFPKETDQYPVFQFDPEFLRIWPIVKSLNLFLGANIAPQFVLNWWATGNPKLSGHAPMDFLPVNVSLLDFKACQTALEFETTLENDEPSQTKLDGILQARQARQANRAAEVMAAFNETMEEVSSEHLSEERMRAIVHDALNGEEQLAVFGDRRIVMEVSRKVVMRDDCPEELLLYVVAKDKTVLREAVLARPGLSEEIRVTAALT